MKRLLSVFLSTTLLANCVLAGQQLPDIKGKKVLFIIASGDFRDEEYIHSREILEGRGATVVVASSSLNTSQGVLGLRVKPDILMDEVHVHSYDAIVFIGGIGAQEYWNNPKAHSIAKEAVEAGKVVGAICIAPVTLANAGILNGKRATVFRSQAHMLRVKGAEYTVASVELDGKIITADGPKSARKFGQAIVMALMAEDS